MKERLLAFAQSAVRIGWDTEEQGALLDFLFARIAPHDGVAPHRTLQLRAAGNGTSQLLRDGEPIAECVERGALAEAVLGEVCYQLVDRSRGGLVVHGAALSFDAERAVLLPGASGAGKSTLSLWLLARGAQYLSDELAWLPEGQLRLEAFVRPLNLKLGSRALLDQLLAGRGREQVLRWRDGDLVAPEVFSGPRPIARARLARVVFPRFQPGAALALSALTPAQLTKELLGTVANARNLPRHGLPEAARIAREVSGQRLVYGDTRQLPEFEALLRAELGA
jgi:hypothetical protein